MNIEELKQVLDTKIKQTQVDVNSIYKNNSESFSTYEKITRLTVLIQLRKICIGENSITLKDFKWNLSKQLVDAIEAVNSMYETDLSSVSRYIRIIRLETLLEIREALKEVE